MDCLGTESRPFPLEYLFMLEEGNNYRAVLGQFFLSPLEQIAYPGLKLTNLFSYNS